MNFTFASVFILLYSHVPAKEKTGSEHGLYITMREGLETWQMVVLAPGHAMTSLMEALPSNPWGNLKNTDSQAKFLHVLKDPSPTPPPSLLLS